MGVDGFKLLDNAVNKDVIALMLTAHALSPKNTAKSIKEGAALYIPKDKIIDIQTYLNDVLKAKEKGKSSWWPWFERFGEFYNKKFGANWRVSEKEMWDIFERTKFEGLKHYYMPRQH